MPRLSISFFDVKESKQIEAAVQRLSSILVDSGALDTRSPIRLTAYYINGVDKPVVGFKLDYPEKFMYRKKSDYTRSFDASVFVGRNSAALDIMSLVVWRFASLLVLSHGIHWQYQYDTCWWFRIDPTGFNRDSLNESIDKLEIKPETRSRLKELGHSTIRELVLQTELELEWDKIDPEELKVLRFSLSRSFGLELGMTHGDLRRYIPPPPRT